MNDLSTRMIIQNFFDRFSPQLKKKIEKIDKKFIKIFVFSRKSNKKLEERYPQKVYWWLYGDPKNAPWFKGDIK